MATEASGAVAVGAAILGAVTWAATKWIDSRLDDKLGPIRNQTKQLDHNGGGHVADYAKDARDESRKTNEKLDALAEKLNTHLVEESFWRGQIEERVKSA
jgi:hypothetical protein